MKKAFIVFLLLFTSPVFAADPIVFSAGGKTYYLKDLESLISAKNDICIEKITNGNVEILYNILLQACQQSLANIDGQIKERGGTTPAFGAGFENTYLKVIAQISNSKQALKACLLNKEVWLGALNQTKEKPKTVMTYTVAADIDACINSIGEHWDTGSCPINPAVSDKRLIANITGVLNNIYQGKTFRFDLAKNEKIAVQSYSQYVVFNGDVFVICNNNKAIQIVHPVYSGRLQCQDGKFQSIPSVGSIPNGVYVARHGDIDYIADSRTARASWGSFRIPLISANETKTHDRTNMYLHGTNDPNKEQSAGCISLGQSISDFVETTWNTQLGQQDLIIFVQIDQIQSLRKGNRLQNQQQSFLDDYPGVGLPPQ